MWHLEGRRFVEGAFGSHRRAQHSAGGLVQNHEPGTSNRSDGSSLPERVCVPNGLGWQCPYRVQSVTQRGLGKSERASVARAVATSMFHKQEGPNIELDKPAPEDRALLGPIFGYQRLSVNRLASCVSRLSV